jgi:Tol biopolymer transport system component
MAAFVANVTDGPARLFVSAMPTPSWKQVAAFAAIDLPAWSGEGKWISFRVSDLQGGEDYYVVHPDGSGLKNLTATGRLPAGDRPYNADVWIADNLVVHSGRPGHAAKVYLVRADDARVTALFDSVTTTKVSYSPSPDGSRLAFDEYDENSQSDSLRIIAVDGSGLRTLANFKGSISSVAWSPDGTRLVFAVFGKDNPPHSDVYVINQDGSGLEQAYAGASISSLTFSPDGKFLLLGSMEQGRVYVADLSNLTIHLIQAPGLNLTDWWREPTWVR